MKRFALPLVAALVLAGCSAPQPVDDVDPQAGTSASSPSAKPTASTPTPAPVTSTGLDVTAEVKAVSPSVESYVVSGTVTEPGRITVGTTLVDPRGENGSPEALLAIQLCDDVVSLGGISNVSIMENDGSSWVLYGHPSYGNVCTEV